MMVTGQKKLMRQMRDLPKGTRKSLEKSVERTVNSGVRKAKAIVPVADGDLKSWINGNVETQEDQILGFINFSDGSRDDALAAASINYGWGNTGAPYNFRATVKQLISRRHKQSVRRSINKAIKDVMSG